MAGPDPSVLGVSGLALARDGTGALVFRQSVGGVPHVFASLLRGGRFQPPLRLDSGLAGPSSQAVVAAGRGGLTLIAFVNGGTIYTVTQPSGLSAPSAPSLVGAGTNPAIALSDFGKGYLAFTTGGAGGHNVRSAFFYLGQWALAPGALNANPAADAGSGSGRPAVGVSGDGTAIVVWGEAGHVYARRVVRTAVSTAVEQVDPPSFAGESVLSADQPAVGTGGNSSYAAIAFHALLSNGSVTQSRVLVGRLVASTVGAVSGADGLSAASSEGADAPQIAVGESGTGFITSAGTQSNNVFDTPIDRNDRPGGTGQVNSLGQASPPDATPATAGLISLLIAWQQDPGGGAAPEIRVRYAPNGPDLGPEQVVSSPALGPTAAGLGLAAAGDVAGDAVIAWVQGSGAQTQIVSAQLFQSPGRFNPTAQFAYSRTRLPLLAWSPAGEFWGALDYAVTLDGQALGHTPGTSLTPSTPLTQGRHLWSVSATNIAGLTTADTRTATVFVDSVAPLVKLQLSGVRQVASRLALRVTATDTPAGLPAADGSGVKSLQVAWGDRSKSSVRGRVTHVYTHRGRFRLTVTARDRAGNSTVLSRLITIKPKPKPKPKRPKHRRPRH